MKTWNQARSDIIEICSWILAETEPECGFMSSAHVISLQDSNVKTDYGPLLHTLAEFGWLLTCVLPTPIIRHDR